MKAHPIDEIAMGRPETFRAERAIETQGFIYETMLTTSKAEGLCQAKNRTPCFHASRSLGPAESPPGTMHVELSSGLIPHRPPPSGDRSKQTWREASDIDLTGFQPGFDKPAVGDRFLGMGRWIIDCGHDNYQTELHPLSFLAWAQTQSDTTVVRTYFNPYRDTETYSPDASEERSTSPTPRINRAP